MGYSLGIPGKLRYTSVIMDIDSELEIGDPSSNSSRYLYAQISLGKNYESTSSTASYGLISRASISK